MVEVCACLLEKCACYDAAGLSLAKGESRHFLVRKSTDTPVWDGLIRYSFENRA